MMIYTDTAAPRNTGSQGTNKFHLLLADFCYCQHRKLKEMTLRDQGLAFVIGGFPLLLGPVLRDLTVYPIVNIRFSKMQKLVNLGPTSRPTD